MPADLFTLMPRALAALPALAALCGCTYASTYVPPADGRARVVWRETGVVPHLPRPVPPACAGEIEEAMNGDEVVVVPASGGGGGVGVVWWVPLPGPVIVVEGGGRAPGRTAASPVPGRTAARPRAGGVGGSGARGPSAGGVRGAGRARPSSGSGGGGKGLSGQAAAVVAVIALVAIPAFIWGIAATGPEEQEETSAAIDRVNAYNDLTRVGDPACVEGEP